MHIFIYCILLFLILFFQASTPSETSESGISGVTTPSSTEGTTSTSSNILFSENSVVDDNVPDLNLLGLVEEMEEQTARYASHKIFTHLEV